MVKHLNNFKVILLTILISIATGCVSTEPSTSNPGGSKTDINSTVAPSTFDWKTSQTVNVQIIGLPTITPVKKTLKIFGTGGTYYTALYLMSDTSNIKVEAPAVDKELNLSFGSLELKSAILNGAAKFSFIPDTTSIK